MPNGRDLWIVLRRFLALWALVIWQGGFFFYASVVVPAAQREIGHFQQGLITRRVTVWMNYAGALSLTLLALDAVRSPDRRPMRRGLLWSAWLAMALCQIALFLLHPRLDALLDSETWTMEPGFRMLHRIYLWVHTVQWAFGLVFAALWLAAWRANDRSATP